MNKRDHARALKNAFAQFDIVGGTIFDTPFETECVAIGSPDEFGNFDAYDSENVICGYSILMVTNIRGLAE